MNGSGSTRDPRLTPARADLAAASLRGEVEAPRFVEGEQRCVVAAVADLKRRPRRDAPLDTQLLFGESVRVFADEEGWAWVQAERDGYVGYVVSDVLGPPVEPPTHRVIVNRTFVYPAPDMKQPIQAALPLDARFRAAGRTGDFMGVAGGYVFSAHLAPIDRPAPDFVAVAEQLVGTPYLWGGKSPGGIDCSGLVQLATAIGGRDLPRDTDMQEGSGCGASIDIDSLRRGDLVFWRGHVGIMVDGRRLLHANGHHMLVMCEPLGEARARIRSTAGLEISSAKRLA